MMQRNMKCKLQCDRTKISKEFVVCIVIEMNAKHLFPKQFQHTRLIQHLSIVCFQLVFLVLLEIPIYIMVCSWLCLQPSCKNTYFRWISNLSFKCIDFSCWKCFTNWKCFAKLRFALQHITSNGCSWRRTWKRFLTMVFHVLQTKFLVGFACAIWKVKWWDMCLIKALDIAQWKLFNVLFIIMCIWY